MKNNEEILENLCDVTEEDILEISDENKCLIYKLTNEKNGKIYIGQTWMTLNKRMGRKGNNYSNSTYLYNAIQKHGYENFTYTILAEVTSQESADEIEAKFIIELNSLDRNIGYNLKEGGRGGKHTEETKQKISETLRNKEWSPEALAGRSKAGSQWLGKKRGPMSEEQKAKVIKTLIYGGFEGHHHTDEAKKKISIKNTGKVDTPETTKRRSKAQLKTTPEFDAEVAAFYLLKDSTWANVMSKYNLDGASHLDRILARTNTPLKGNHDTWSGRTHSEAEIDLISRKQQARWDIKKMSQFKKDKIIIDHESGFSLEEIIISNNVTIEVVEKLVEIYEESVKQKKVVEIYSSGKDVFETSNELKTNGRYVRRILRENNITIRDSDKRKGTDL